MKVNYSLFFCCLIWLVGAGIGATIAWPESDSILISMIAGIVVLGLQLLARKGWKK